MAYKIVILESAEYDLKELRGYLIKKFSLKCWQTSYHKIKTSIRNLKFFPEIGFIPEELENINMRQYRQIISGMNRIIYEVRQQTIYIHIIADSRQEFKPLLMTRLLNK